MKYLCIFQSAEQTSQPQRTAPKPPGARQPAAGQWPRGPLLWVGASLRQWSGLRPKAVGPEGPSLPLTPLQGGQAKSPREESDPCVKSPEQFPRKVKTSLTAPPPSSVSPALVWERFSPLLLMGTY